MNLKNRLNHIANKLDSARRFGKTTLMTKVCKELNGIYLCANMPQAKLIKHEHGVITQSIDHNLDGYSGPFFIDNHAVACLLQRASNKIAKQEELIKTLQEEILTLEYDIVLMQTKDKK